MDDIQFDTLDTDTIEFEQTAYPASDPEYRYVPIKRVADEEEPTDFAVEADPTIMEAEAYGHYTQVVWADT